MTLGTEELTNLRGAEVHGRDGDKIGKVDEIYLDQQTGRPEWALVNTGLFGSRSSFVPLSGASQADDNVIVEWDKARVKDAPNIDADGQLSQEEEAQLYRHYGLDYSHGGDAGTGDFDGDTGRDVGHRHVTRVAAQGTDELRQRQLRGNDGRGGRRATGQQAHEFGFRSGSATL
jgi:sporulation protein YlmC with PRC-barrel domain